MESAQIGKGEIKGLGKKGVEKKWVNWVNSGRAEKVYHTIEFGEMS